MDTRKVLSRYEDGSVFSRSEFHEAVRAYEPTCADTAIDWALHDLRRKGILESAGAGRYYMVTEDTQTRLQYHYLHSSEYYELEECISSAYPLVNYQMWELIQMNDFVNHQIAKNVIFVEVESMLVDTIYEVLHTKYPYAMFQPDTDTFYRQRGPQTDIVVMKLLTEAPTPDEHHSCRIEKILVDLLSRKLPGQLVERSEYPRIYEDVFHKYAIDETRMLRYARRRNLRDALVTFITTQTNVRLMTV